MILLKKIPHTYTIIAVLILICAVLSWVIPAGEYERQIIEVKGVKRTVIVDNSFHRVEQSPQTWQVFGSLMEGFEKQSGIIAFLLIIGGAFQILNSGKAVDVGILSFLRFTQGLERYRFMKYIGVNNIVISLIIILFSLFGSVFGMSEETLAFIVIIVPLAIRMGYDSITGLCMVYVAAHVGFSGAVLNPFTIGIAQGLSDLPLFSGFTNRLLCWGILTTVLIIGVLIYAGRVKRNPACSCMYEADNYWRNRSIEEGEKVIYTTPFSSRIVYFLILGALGLFSVYYPVTTLHLGESSVAIYAVPVLTVLYAFFGWFSLRKSFHFFVLTILGFTIVFLVTGVMGYGWYLTEISALFLAMGIMSGFAMGKGANELIQSFLDGAKDILSAAIVVGLAGGIIQILQDGRIIDPILHGLATLMNDAGKVIAIGGMYLIQTLINIVIPSGSAKAALTMPIMAPFSDVIGISRQATVMAFQFGDGFTNMITPTSAVLIGALGIARVPYEIWVKWFFRFLIVFILLGFILLIPTVIFPLDGF